MLGNVRENPEGLKRQASIYPQCSGGFQSEASHPIDFNGAGRTMERMVELVHARSARSISPPQQIALNRQPIPV